MCYDEKSAITYLGDLLRDYSCTIHNLPTDLSLESEILECKAVMSGSKELGNIGDFVKVSSPQLSNASFF